MNAGVFHGQRQGALDLDQVGRLRLKSSILPLLGRGEA